MSYNKLKREIKMSYETPLTIAEAMQNISSNKYVLPSIQREYVWKTEQIEALFDSLMQGYPIGSFLFWEVSKEKLQDYNFYEFLRNYHERDAKHNRSIDLKGAEGATAILDGQQRLTSLYIGLKGSYAYRSKYKNAQKNNSYPERKLYLNLFSKPNKNDNGNEYDFKFLTKEVVNDANNYWFEVGQILNLKYEDISDYVDDNIWPFLKDCENEKEKRKSARRVLSRLSEVICKNAVISYYKEKSEELDKVLNIFIRVNSGGTMLTYSDLLLSTVSAQWKNYDAREEIISFVKDLNLIGNGFNTNKDFVLKSALVLTDFSNIAFKVDNFNKSNMEKIENNWENIKKTLILTFKLIDSFGYSDKTLTTYNALIPIAYYLMTIGIPSNFINSSSTQSNRSKIKKWLIKSMLKKTFSGQPDNVIIPLRDILRENGNNDFPIDKIVEKFRGKNNKSIIFTQEDIDEYLLQLKYGDPITLSTLMLLYPSLDFKNKFHEDHIYPQNKLKNKKYLKEMGVSEDKLNKYKDCMNNISNLQLLPATLNEEKSNTDFSDWFEKTYKTDEEKANYRQINYIPDMEYSYENFLNFMTERKAILKSELEKILL